MRADTDKDAIIRKQRDLIDTLLHNVELLNAELQTVHGSLLAIEARAKSAHRVSDETEKLAAKFLDRISQK